MFRSTAQGRQIRRWHTAPVARDHRGRVRAAARGETPLAPKAASALLSAQKAAGSAPILVVSGESAEAAKVKALGIGADDYLVKPFGKAELLARIAAVMRRVDRATGAATSGPLSAGDLYLEPARHEARVGETALLLTPTEFRLLEALVRAAGDIVPHHLLARAGWPAESDPDLLWLKPHLARLRSKVEGAGGPRILAVRGVGYRIDADGVAAELLAAE